MSAPDSAVEALRQRIGEALSQGRRVAVIGIGSALHGDDAAGVLAAQAAAQARIKNLRGIVGGTAPENVTGEIAGFAPHIAVFVDAAEMGLKPGQTRLLKPEEIGGISFSTHTLPLRIMIEYLSRRIRCEFLVLGVQPERLEFGAGLSTGVKRTIADLDWGHVSRGGEV